MSVVKSVHTRVGTQDLAPRSASTDLLPTPYPRRKIQSRACSMMERWSSVSERLRVSRRFISKSVPMSLILSFEMRHRGQGQRPRFRTVAIMVLLVRQYRLVTGSWKYSPFGIVCRVGDEPWEHQPGNAIFKSNLNAMLVCLEEFLVDEQGPSAVVEITL
jgi:hypothetical protein